MRIATIRWEGKTAAARLDGSDYTVLPFSDVGQLLASGADWRATAETTAGPVLSAEGISLAPLVTFPEKIVCVGLNYRDHAEETGQPIPQFPTLFAKYARSLIGAGDELVLPPASTAVDWELELGVVIGQPVRHASVTESADAIAGYTVINDISMRDWQMRTSQYLQGKTFEASTPVGPCLVTPDEIDHARDLQMRCDVNGEVVQSSTTANLIFSPAEIVSYISTIITLMPGDLIATGTPGGVGAAMKPPRYLQAGETLTSMIEGLGTLTTRCV